MTTTVADCVLDETYFGERVVALVVVACGTRIVIVTLCGATLPAVVLVGTGDVTVLGPVVPPPEQCARSVAAVANTTQGSHGANDG